MFNIARRKSHSQLVRKELGESLDHFVQAATHAARGAGATVGPRVDQARGRVTPAAGKVKNAATDGWGSTVAALAPLAAAATNSARQAGTATRKAKAQNAKAMQKNAKAAQKAAKSSRKKNDKAGGSKFAKLLMAGAAVGAAGALIMRRRKQQQWDQYDPSMPMGGSSSVDNDSMLPASLAPESTTGTSFTPATGTTGKVGSTGTGSGSTTGKTPLVTDPAGDQTSSPMHTPTVARMAGGSAPGTAAD